MAAAAVARGEKSMDDITFILGESQDIYGSYQTRPTALAKVTGTCDYGDDINMKMPSGTLHLAPVFAGVSHGNLLDIDVEEAMKMPGVRQVITHKDIKGTNRLNYPVGMLRSKTPGHDQPVLIDKKIVRYGDIVALVAAETREMARAAAKKVAVKFDSLPEYMTLLEALAEDAMEIHPGVPNIYVEQPHFFGADTREIMDRAEYVVEGSFYSQRQPHLVIEPDCAAAYMSADAVLTIHCKSLDVNAHRPIIADAIGYPLEKIRIIENPTGASFGYTASAATEALIGSAVLATGCPCALTLSYEEHQPYTGKRNPSYSNSRLAADKDGRLVAMEYELAYEKGSYAQQVAALLNKAPAFMGFPYRIPNIRGLSKAGYSNQTYGIAYRSYGTVETHTASETIIDMMAEKVGVDPLEFRALNVLRDGEICGAGHTLDSYGVGEMIDRIRPRYQDTLTRCKKLSTEEKKRGVGVSISSFKVGLGPGDQAQIALELNPDGTVTHYNTWEQQGQGADVGTVVHTCKALGPLGIRPDQVRLMQNDTGMCPNSGPAAGSRSHVMVGNATIDAANKLMNAMRKSDGSYRTYDEMRAEGIPTKHLGAYSFSGLPLANPDRNTGLGQATPLFTYALFMAEVEVDIKTGKVAVVMMECIADIGKVGCRQATEGQAYSGMEHGIGFALGENYFDAEKHANLVGAGFPYIEKIPDELHVEFMETHLRDIGPYGSSGCCEAMQSSPHVAVGNAVYNAVGVRIFEYPITPEKILNGIAAKQAGKEMKPRKYYLGPDLFERLDDIAENPM
jgi:aldehyde oxidoreductase